MENAKRTKEEWRKILSPEVFHITREKGTEAPGSGEYDLFFDQGMYYCSNCRAPLFVSENKYDARCGWPSFDRPASPDAVEFAEDRSLGMVRTEVICANCGAHLGHLFDDGPKDTTGQRYCINSLALDFKSKDAKN